MPKRRPAGRRAAPTQKTEAILTDIEEEKITVAKNRSRPDPDLTRKKNATQRGVQPESDHQAVVGWLVCTNGTEKGKDYRLYSGHNHIGTDLDMDVCLQAAGIASSNHATITYDEDTNRFSVFTYGASVFLNGKLISKAEELKSNDRIALGEMQLDFIAYCKGSIKW